MSVVLPILRQPVSHSWDTPIDLFNTLDREFGFALDVAATADNALCQRFYTVESDGLAQQWDPDGGAVWCNPPYGGEIPKWVCKCYQGALMSGNLVEDWSDE